MVGVFDPKSEQFKPGKTIKGSVLAGVALLSLGGIGAFLLPGLLNGQQSDKSTVALTETAPDKLNARYPETAQLAAYHPMPNSALSETRTATLKSGDTLTDVMDRLGVGRGEANSALYALYDTDLIDPRKVRPGLEISAYVSPTPTDEDAEAVRLVGLTLKHEREASLVVVRNSDESFSAHELHTRLIPQTRRVTGTVETSLYDAALQAGAHDAQVYEFAQIYAYDVDFQREMRIGDRFEIVFEEYTDEKGRYVRSGDILFAKLSGHATDRGFYRFTPSDDLVTDFFDENGESATKFLMKTPINGARLSSNFGYRKHPISGYSKLHKGTDFAAPTGTPIFAAGNGVVERSSRYGGYGNYVRLRHPNGYQTAYAHMSKYGPGIKSGVRVKQGDIVGYVGSTGASTGPHLHYEVIKDGQHVNAMTLKLPTGRKLEGDILQNFLMTKAEIDELRGLGETHVLYAAATSNDDRAEDKADVTTE